MTIRLLTTLDEFDQCRELQREAFGSPESELTPVRHFVVLAHIGGAVLGAFDNDRLVGFVAAMPGIRHCKPFWHSQMMAIATHSWNSGVATQLKFAQRDEAIARGLHLIEWTFNPLESKNAHLNINKLGVIVRRYYPNHYGQVNSAIYQGLESDRVIAEWWLGEPRIAVSGETRRVSIPADLQSLKKDNLSAARDEQRRIREEFLKHIQDDFFVVAVERKGDVSDYVFIRGASGVHSTD